MLICPISAPTDATPLGSNSNEATLRNTGAIQVRQCDRTSELSRYNRRIPDKQTLIEEVAAWEKDRNKKHSKADWQFTTADARIKLKRLYPAI